LESFAPRGYDDKEELSEERGSDSGYRLSVVVVVEAAGSIEVVWEVVVVIEIGRGNKVNIFDLAEGERCGRGKVSFLMMWELGMEVGGKSGIEEEGKRVRRLNSSRRGRGKVSMYLHERSKTSARDLESGGDTERVRSTSLPTS